MGQVLAMGICPTGADQYCLYRGYVSQVVCECSFHGFCILQQRQRVYLAAVGDKLLDLGKGMCVLNVDALHGGFYIGSGIRGLAQAFAV